MSKFLLCDEVNPELIRTESVSLIVNNDDRLRKVNMQYKLRSLISFGGFLKTKKWIRKKMLRKLLPRKC